MNQKKKIYQKELTRSDDNIRLCDSTGRVFIYQGRVYRGIYPKRLEFIRRLFERGVVERLIDSKLLIPTRLSNVEIEGFELVLEHDKIDVLTDPTEWSLVTYLEGAKTFIDLFTELYRNNLMLGDGHPWNISMAPGGRTIWHDFGSVRSVFEAENGVARAINEFLETFYFPLRLYARTGEYNILHRLQMQCSRDEYLRITHPHLARLMRRTAVHRSHSTLARVVNKACRLALCGSVDSSSLIQSVIDTVRSCVLGRTQRRPDVLRLLGWLRDQISRIPIESPDASVSENYRENTSLNFKNEIPWWQHQILTLVQDFRPNRVLVIESQQCGFSVAALGYCNCVVSLDHNVRRASKRALLLRERNNADRIYPLACDVMFADVESRERLRSHTVVALSLTHQLRLQQGYSWRSIAKKLAGLSEKYLITDFMPNGLGQMEAKPSPLPFDYTLETFLEVLGDHFHKVKVINRLMGDGETPRTIVLCEK